jgi:hypothetical protein
LERGSETTLKKMETSRRYCLKIVSTGGNFDEQSSEVVLSISKESEEYAKRLEALYEEITSIPHFNDTEVMLKDSGISFFHKETQKEIAWTVSVCLQAYLKINRAKVSHVLTNKDFKIFAESTEAYLEGKSFTITRDHFGLGKLVVSDTQEDY